MPNLGKPTSIKLCKAAAIGVFINATNPNYAIAILGKFNLPERFLGHRKDEPMDELRGKYRRFLDTQALPGDVKANGVFWIDGPVSMPIIRNQKFR